MRELFLLSIGLITGSVMIMWSSWQIYRHFSISKEERHGHRFYFRVALFVGLIGLGDFSKSLREMIQFFTNRPSVSQVTSVSMMADIQKL